MVPELMAYQAMIVKCSRDFEGLAWAQYDRAYRRQAAQTKDLRWSRLNPTLFSLCFTGKARRNIACAHCQVITTPRILAQRIHLALSFCGNIQVPLLWARLLRWVWLLRWVGLILSGCVSATYLTPEMALNALTARASLPMFAQPAEQIIRDPRV